MADSVLSVGKNITNKEKELERFKFLIKENEKILLAYEGLLDAMIITDKKFIGFTGKKTEYTIIPLQKISAFSFEIPSSFDTELKIWAAGMGLIITKINTSLIKNGSLEDLTNIFNEYICK